MSDMTSEKDKTTNRAVAAHANEKHSRQPKQLAVDSAAEEVVQTTPSKGFGSWLRTHKKVYIPSLICLLLIVLFAVPPTRYLLSGLVLKKNFSITVVDSQTQKPVSSALVSLDGRTATTNNVGVARLNVKVGHGSLTISKKYYQTSSESVLVPIGSQKGTTQISLIATGRQVPVTVLNKINGQPVANVAIDGQGTEAKTDAKGQATIVLPANLQSTTAKVSGNGYNTATITITVTAAVTPANTFQVTPSGKLYFLSNLSGTIDVVKTNLDGTDRQTVLTGTGNETPTNTALLATRDWKYLALSSVRDTSGHNQLNLIDTTNNDKVTNIDSGNAYFTPVGWSGDSFVYLVNRDGVSSWQPNAQSIKSYNAQTGSLTVLDSSSANGTGDQNARYESYFANDIHILGSQVIFAKTWYSPPGYINVTGQQNTLSIVAVDGSNKKVIDSRDSATAYFGTVYPYQPNELLVQISPVGTGSVAYYTYKTDGTYAVDSDTSQDQNILLQPYPTYLLSPSGNQTFWSVARDGKNELFVGDANGQNGKQLGGLSDYTVYGWYTNNYLLVSKSGSELYIMPVNGGTALKVSDYYKPAFGLYGYGSGYGGL